MRLAGHSTEEGELAVKGKSLYKIATLMGNSPEICRRHCAPLIPEEIIDGVDSALAVGENCRAS